MVFSLPLIAMANMDAEIRHLLKFAEESSCKYERNGKMHTSKKAVEHIQSKHNYYKDDIKATEDFIRLAATKSTMSGKYYLIHCPGQDVIKSKDWLLQELMAYRKSQVTTKVHTMNPELGSEK